MSAALQADTVPKVVIIGAGPAGLTAAYELSKRSIPSMILEADGVVGGISRTAEYNGYLFDIGGHPFFTKVSLVEHMWREVLGADFITRPRLSHIYYKSRFFHYPHRYNNQDHSMLTAMLAARNLTGSQYDLWQVNADSEYGEHGQEITKKELRKFNASQPMTPRRAAAAGR